ncbi:hypothetical protein DX195_24845, partial [Salmonella enterica]|nr:hypothetical protein [Salmonella enterica]
NFLEVDLYENFKGRSRQQKYQVDHIPSAAAVKANLKENNPDLTTSELNEKVGRVASIAVPRNTHLYDSETYGGRNNEGQIAKDAKDLRAAADSNFNAIIPSLKNEGATSEQIENARKRIHKLNEEQGLYK